MAELAKLEIQLGADIQDSLKGLNTVGDAISKFSNQGTNDLQKIEKAIQHLEKAAKLPATEKELKDVQQGLSLLRQEAEKLKGLQVIPSNLAGNAKGAAAALNSVGQVVRDLPFGFIAIQNNLPIVLDQFGALARQSGGAINAFKAIGSALVGPAGLAFAFGAIVAGATSLIQQYGSLSVGIAEVLGLISASERAHIKLNTALDSTNAKALTEGETLRNLVAILTDNNASQEERHGAYVRLGKEYPGVLQSMSEENAKTEEGTKLIKERTAQLIKYISLKGKESAITKLIEESTTKGLKAQREMQSTLNDEGTVLDRFFSGVKKSVFGIDIEILKAGRSIGEANDELDFFSKELLQTQKALAAFDPNLIDPGKVGGGGKTKIKVNAEVELIPDKIGLNITNEQADKAINDAFKLQTGAGVDIPLTVSLPQSTIDAFAKFGQLQKDIFDNKQLELYNKKIFNLAQSIAGPLSDAFSGLFETLATEGKLSLQDVGKALQRLVIQFIQAALKAAIFAAVLSAIGGGIPTAGGGLIKGFGNIFKNILGFADGGIVTKPTLAMIGERGEKEAVIPLSRLGDLAGRNNGPMVARLVGAGNDLLVYLQEATRANGRGF